MSRPASLSIENTWNSVALEERLELIARANADGVIAAFACASLVGAVAYGFDQIFLLAVGAAASLLVIPLFASFTWRKNKPELILQYLAVRSMARRYAFGQAIQNLEVHLIFRGFMEESFASAEERTMANANRAIELDSVVQTVKPVWICLMGGAVVVLSERRGGAKLEFLTPINHEFSSSSRENEERFGRKEVFITGAGTARGRKIMITSDYPAALYVFDKQIARLAKEAKIVREKALAVPAGD